MLESLKTLKCSNPNQVLICSDHSVGENGPAGHHDRRQLVSGYFNPNRAYDITKQCTVIRENHSKFNFDPLQKKMGPH